MNKSIGPELENEELGPPKKYPNFHPSMVFIFLFTISYCVFGIWLLFDGWLNGFSSIYWVWNIDESTGIPTVYKLAMMSLVGSILGCGTLDIVSFHKYVAIEKVYDLDHIWGFFISPVLASIVGLVVFALFQSGLLIFSGNFSDTNAPVTAEFGFTAVGFISGYSWYDAINKFRDISEGLFKRNEENANNNSISESLSSDEESELLNNDTDEETDK